jgi:hypothetical protein
VAISADHLGDRVQAGVRHRAAARCLSDRIPQPA